MDSRQEESWYPPLTGKSRAADEEGDYRGMIPKVQCCLEALEKVGRIHIINGTVMHRFLEIFTESGIGTT